MRHRIPDAEACRAEAGTAPPSAAQDGSRQRHSAGPEAVGTDGWEFEGETASNFISPRTKITAALLHDGWSPENQITLDEKLSPRVLLTFRKGELELTLMLWKIDTGTTGFAYRREKIVNPGVELE